MQTLPRDLPAIAADVIERIRARAPRVHCITNTVAQAFTANMLLAAGAVPSMTLAREEIGAFVAGADALLVNLGTFDAERRAAVEAALAAVGRRPWVLDPVFVDRSPARLTFAQSLLTRRPTAVRLNRAELAALTASPQETAPHFAARIGATVAVSGATDTVTDGAAELSIANGHRLMASVTAMGCAGSALLAACLAVEPDALRACGAALLALGIAGEIVAARSAGPGTFAAAILDAVHGLERGMLLQHAKVA